MARDDIDARILLVEQRLLSRQARLREGATALSEHVSDALQPRRFIKPGLIAAAVAALVLLRPRRAVAAQAIGGGNGLRSTLRGLPWVRLLGLAWPLLPARWRGRVPPAAASGFVAMGLPLLEGLLDGHRKHPPLATVASVDLARLAGRWFLVGELPAPLEAETLQAPELGLLPREDGGFDLLQRRIDRHGTHGRQALLRVVPGSHGARLQVSALPNLLHALPWAWTEQHVLHVDEAYDEALIGSPSRESLWLLSRRPALAPERREALTQRARQLGFEVGRLRFSAPP